MLKLRGFKFFCGYGPFHLPHCILRLSPKVMPVWTINPWQGCLRIPLQGFKLQWHWLQVGEEYIHVHVGPPYSSIHAVTSNFITL